MNKTQLTLMLLLAVQVALWTAGVGSRTPSAPAEPQPLVEGLGGYEIARLRLESASGEDSVTLARAADGWVLEDAGGFPADEEKVNDLLEKLQGLSVRRPVATRDRYHEALKVAEDDFERRVQIWAEGEEGPRTDLLVGTAPNYRISNVRRVGEDQVYAVPDLAHFDIRTEGSNWIAEMVPEDLFNDTTWFRLQNAQGGFEFEKRDGEWALVAREEAPRELDTAKVDSLLRGVDNLLVTDAIGPYDAEAQGFDVPAAEITLLLGEKPVADEETGEAPEDERETVVLKLGAVLPEGEPRHYFTREGFGFTAAVRNSNARRLLEDDLEAFLVAPPPPEEEAADGGEGKGGAGDEETGVAPPQPPGSFAPVPEPTPDAPPEEPPAPEPEPEPPSPPGDD